MRKPFLLLFLTLATLFGLRPAAADTVYMIMEQDADGVARHKALDQSTIGDAIDPVTLHIALNKPTDPEAAQVLWVTTGAPAVWQQGAEDNHFQFIEHAVLPEGGMIEYRVYVHRVNVELISKRHRRQASAKEYGIDQTIFDDLQVFDYQVEAHVIVPGRPKQVLTRLLKVTSPEKKTPPQNPKPPLPDDPGPDPDPDVPDEVPPMADDFVKLNHAAAAKIIYVSDSTGDDANDGLTPQTPVKTLERGAGLLRPGNPDWLLLKAGDVWFNQSFNEVNLGGASVDKPMIIGVYGEGKRPLIIPPHAKPGLSTKNHHINGLVIQGLHFYAGTRDPGQPGYIGRPGDINGINIRINSKAGKFVKGLVIEDCKITHFDTNIKLVDDWTRFKDAGVPGRIQATIRRNIIQYASGSDSHSVGIYIEGSRNSVIEQNLIDHNGWAQTDGFEKRNKASHNIYAQSFNGPIVIRHNILTRAAAHAIQLRAGGDIEHNLFARNAMAFWTSINDSKANYNVILESDDMDPSVPTQQRGYGLEGWGMNRYEVIGNVIARRVGSLLKPGIAVSAENLIIKDNKVYDWMDTRINKSIVFGSPNLTMSGNLAKEFNGDREPAFVDPQRGVVSYANSIGLEPSLEGFINYVATRPRGKWDNAYRPDVINDHIRAGFELAK